MRRGIPIRAVLLLLTSASIPVCAWGVDEGPGKTIRVRAEGCASGVTPAAREAAMDQAREAAVWLWVESTLGHPRSDDLLPLLEYLDTYIASSRLLSARAEAGRTCVDAEIYLYETALRTDLAALLFKSRRTPPVVAFLFVENDAPAGARRFQDQVQAAAALVESFRAKGFGVIEPSVTRGVYSERELMSIVEAGPPALARFAADLRADAVVLVDSALSVRPEPGGGRTLRARAELTLLVVSALGGPPTDKASAAAEVTAGDAASGLRVAIGDAVYKIRDRAAVAAVLASQAPDDRYDLTIEGLRDFAAAERVAEALRRLGGVSNASVLSVRGTVVRLQFRYTGRVAAVVEYLESGQAGQPLKAVRVVDRELHFQAGT